MSNRLKTNYLGLDLANPFVPSSSPMTLDRDMPRQLEDNGASAIVMHSLFEEELKHEHEQMHRFMHHQHIGHAEAHTYLPVHDEFMDARDRYLDQLEYLKNALDIPVIASLNGITDSGWIDHALELEKAGADALEVNVFYIAADVNTSSAEVEARYLDILKHLKKTISIPVCMKLSDQFSAPVHFVRQLQEAGAAGVSLFNRFYVPNINLDTLHLEPEIMLSNAHESLSRIRWIGIMRGQLDIDIACTGGMHTSQDIAKALLAGANVTHLCSALLKNGPGYLTTLQGAFLEWMDEKEYESVDQLRGSLCQKNAIDPDAYERCNYLEVIDSYSHASGVHK